MQKMGFNERYGLQQAVFDRTKWKTRRLEKGLEDLKEGFFSFAGKKEVHVYGEKGTLIEIIKPRYQIGEIVAVAQRYSQVYDELFGDVAYIDSKASADLHFKYILMEAQNATIKGWTNKMFVRADLMPRHIQITDIVLQRLQDITDEDCMAEGIKKKSGFPRKKALPYFFAGGKHEWDNSFSTPRKAYAALIDRISGKGTWDSNPWVFAYSFELID